MGAKISIIMAVFNGEATLRESIDSILAQTYENWEFVICDDASTDHTQEILEEYKQRYPEKFILIANQENMRLAFSLNRCLEYATGEYVARMDSDDISSPDRLEKECRFLADHPEIDLVGSAMRRFSEENGLADVESKPQIVDRYYLRKSVPFNHATILTYRRVYEALNGYTVEKRTARCEDYDLWFRFFDKGFQGRNLQEPLYFVREDKNAIRRRTFRSRWERFQTAVVGFDLLGFPKRWLLEEFVVTLCKCLVPYHLIDAYRTFQAKKQEKVQ